MSDEELWEHLEAQGGYAILGVKNPGEPRGIWRMTVLTDPTVMTGAESVAEARQGVEVLGVEEWAPVLRLSIQDLEALSALRTKPFVDYLQPKFMEPVGDEGSMMDGCGWGDTYTGGAPQGPLGDHIPPGLARMSIQDAWRRNAGENAVVGITDTGIASNQANLIGAFASDSSTGRWHDIRTVISGGTNDQCGHGTRLAGLAGLAVAPQNGSSIMGAAWRANAVSVRQGNGVHTSGGINSADAAAAIVMAVEERYYWPHYVNQRRIVSMAWGAGSSHSNVEDAVRYTEGLGALHLGASGTGIGWLTGAVFPSTMKEVISVSAVDEDKERVSGIGYGDAVELAAYIDQLGTGQFTSQTRTVGGSSAAVTAMSGIAALVWTQYPSETNAQIRDCLQKAAHAYPQRNTTYGFGVVNATKAVGGMYNVQIDAPFWVDPYQTFTVTANPQGGDGPFTYQWSNGATTRSTTYTAGPEGSTVHYSVTVTDTSDGITRTPSGTSYVQDRSGCIDPTQIEC